MNDSTGSEIVVGVGVSHHRNPRIAGTEAARQALVAAGIDRADFVLMFATVGYDQSVVVKAVREATGGAPLSGCSAEGTISSGQTDESNFSVSVMVMRSSRLRFEHGLAIGLKTDSAAVGREIAKDLEPRLREDVLALLLFPDGICVNFDKLLAGFAEVLGTDKIPPMFGGACSENWTMRQTYQYCGDQVVSNGAAWVLISGQARIVSGISHGCVPIGAVRKVTKSEANAIYEIDGKPVLDVLGEYLVGDELGNWEKAVLNVAIGIEAPEYFRQHDREHEYVITRFMPSPDDVKQGCVTVPTEVPEGTSIWVTRRDHEKIVTGLDRLVTELREKLHGEKPLLAFHFDCAGRGKVMFREQQQVSMVKSLHDRLGCDTSCIGFYTYGEIAPVGSMNRYHNYTAVLLVLY